MSAGGLVRVSRGDLDESEHRFVWALTDHRAVVATGGALDAVFVRSAAKPLQALGTVHAGVLERFGLDDRHLAVACASHGGGPEHVARVAEILAACGLDAGALACGPLEPRDPAAAAALAAERRPVAPIHHNCSGKHALGLARCVAEGWPLDGYPGATHPLQRSMRASVADATGVDPATLSEATDGCGMRTYRVRLDRLALAFARLAGGRLGPTGARVAAAMRAHPALVAFDGALDSELMAAEPGVVAKIGAEGVVAIGTGDGRGLAVKVVDGAARALDPAAITAARAVLALGFASPALNALATPAIRDSRGRAVGRLQAQPVSRRPG